MLVALPVQLLYAPRHNKNKMSARPAKTQISLGIRPVWSIFAIRMKRPWVLSYSLGAQRRLWSDWVDVQADMSLRWAHSHFVGFVMSYYFVQIKNWCKRLLPCKKEIPNIRISFIIVFCWKWMDGWLSSRTCFSSSQKEERNPTSHTTLKER